MFPHFSPIRLTLANTNQGCSLRRHLIALIWWDEACWLYYFRAVADNSLVNSWACRLSGESDCWTRDVLVLCGRCHIVELFYYMLWWACIVEYSLTNFWIEMLTWNVIGILVDELLSPMSLKTVPHHVVSEEKSQFIVCCSKILFCPINFSLLPSMRMLITTFSLFCYWPKWVLRIVKRKKCLIYIYILIHNFCPFIFQWQNSHLFLLHQ